MSDYEMLNALLDDYRDELKRRKDGVAVNIWNSRTDSYDTAREIPANKARLNRLRLEISRLMLEIERKMT